MCCYSICKYLLWTYCVSVIYCYINDDDANDDDIDADDDGDYDDDDNMCYSQICISNVDIK